MTRILFVLLGLLVATAALADTVVLKTGRRLEGTIEKETETAVTIRLEFGRMTIPRTRIAKIERGAGRPPSVTSRPGDTADGHRPRPEIPSDRPEPRDGKRIGEPPAPGFGPLLDAMRRGDVTVEARGLGIGTVRLHITTNASRAVRIHVAAGLFYVPVASDDRVPPDRYQPMVGVGGVNVVGEPGASVKLDVPVCCAHSGKKIPHSTVRFEVRTSFEFPDLAKLIRVFARSRERFLDQQAAVWIVTNDATYEILGRLRLTSVPGLSGSRQIGPVETARAMQICEEAGIDLRSRRIDRDSHALIRTFMKNDETSVTARRWALNRLRIRHGYRGSSEEELVVDVLLRGTEREDVLAACETAVARRFPRATEPLARLVREARDHVIARCARNALAGYGQRPSLESPPAEGSPEARLDERLADLKSEDPATRRLALEGLRQTVLATRSPVVRRRVADAVLRVVASVTDREARAAGPILEACVGVLEPSELTRAARGAPAVAREVVVRVLGRIRKDAAATELVRFLTDAEEGVRDEAVRGLRGRERIVVDLIARRVRTITPEAGVSILEVVQALEGKSAQKVLIRLLPIVPTRTKGRVMDRLVEAFPDAAVGPIGAQLRYGADHDARPDAIDALERLGDRRALVTLRSARRELAASSVEGRLERAIATLERRLNED